MKKIISLLTGLIVLSCTMKAQSLRLNAEGYFEIPGLNVMVFHDNYPEGHQGALTLIQNGTRVATNGDLRLEPTPGQWQPIPKMGKRTVDYDKNEITVRCTYPDSGILAKGFNPVFYPDLHFRYEVRVRAEGKTLFVNVDLEKPLPGNWDQKVGFNLELYPGDLFGKTWYMDGQSGLFPTQPNGPMQMDVDGNWQAFPLAQGHKLTVAPDDPDRLMIIESKGEPLQLIDGRFYHNNGWFVVRSLVNPGKTRNAIEWVIDAEAREGFKSKPVVQINQVGYHPLQQKMAVIELDKTESTIENAELIRLSENGEEKIVKSVIPASWGKYYRYNYYQFDFSEIEDSGIYLIRYGTVCSDPFRISAGIFKRHVWQPTLEYFLPVQMCHMRINEGYRVWHGYCHGDDALMAPVNLNHFDGYVQGPSTLTKFKPIEHVPGLNAGGWHDAGDYDLRVESQAGTLWVLALTYELFKNDWDQTTIDQQNSIVEIHRPDGKPDILQQVEHGLLTILGGYRNLGRLYRGIICPTLRQYVLLGDGSTMTDGKVYTPDPGTGIEKDDRTGIIDDRWEITKKDDRWVFTEEEPDRELAVVEALAVAARVMKGYNDTLRDQSMSAAEELYAHVDMNLLEQMRRTGAQMISGLYGYYVDDKKYERTLETKIRAAAELFITTGRESYKKDLLHLLDDVALKNSNVIAYTGKILPKLGDTKLTARINEAARNYRMEIDRLEKESPYNVPFPHKMGSSWGLQTYSMKQYHLYRAFPEIFDGNGVIHALNAILGLHPGENTASFVSGVGSRSATVAYGINRADGSFVPGGTIKGTLIIKPDLPELKIWPFMWQESEYVLDAQHTGGAAHFMFLVMAAEEILSHKE